MNSTQSQFGAYAQHSGSQGQFGSKAYQYLQKKGLTAGEDQVIKRLSSGKRVQPAECSS